MSHPASRAMHSRGRDKNSHASPSLPAGAVKRVGRCDAYATEFDLEAEEYVPLPKGDVHKKKAIVQVNGQ